MRIAIVHDFLAQGGGAERVVEAIHAIWPDAPIYTSVYDPQSTFSSFQKMDVRTSFLQRIPLASKARHHKKFLALYPLAFEMLDLRGYDVVLSNTSSFAKGVITGPETCHICYCHTPMRFAWRYREYMSQGGFKKNQRFLLPFIIHYLRMWDITASRRVDYFLGNSANICRRILKYYGRESEILYPPVETSRFYVEPKPTEDYLLVVSRLISYKRVDLAVEACTRLNLPLKVVGGGPDEARLRAMAGPSVEFLGRVPDGQVEALFANCRAFLFPGEEDFGITPLEVSACGRPVIAFRAGGAMETIVDGETGLFFDDPSVESLIDAIRRLDSLRVDSRCIRAHAERFDTSVFHARLRRYVEDYYDEHTRRYAAFSPHRSLR